MRCLSAGLIAGFTLAGAPSFAEQGDRYVRIAGGASIGGDVGQNIAHDPDLVFIIAPPTERTVDFDPGYALGAAIGYAPRDRVRTELEYRFVSTPIDQVAHRGGFSPDPDLDPNVTVASDDRFAAHALLLNVVYDFETASAFTPFAGLGLGAAQVEADGGGDDTTVAYQARLGVARDAGAKGRVGLELNHLWTHDLAFGPDPIQDGVVTEPHFDGDGYAATSVMVSYQRAF